MEIINTFALYHQEIVPQKSAMESTQIPDDKELWFDDPDAAYSYWIKLDIFEPNEKFNQQQLINQMIETNQIQLNLQKKRGQQFSFNIMKQHSIQISLFEALILSESLTKKQSSRWQLELTQSDDISAKFKLSSTNVTFDIHYHRKQNKLVIKKNNTSIGTLTIDIEKQVLEKIHGRLNDRPFIIDPVWKQSQTTLDAVKVNLGGFSTEIVHHPKHKQTIWRGKQSSIMAITQNKTFQINQNLFLNKKQLEWPKLKFSSVQWVCPWQRFPISGTFVVDSKI